jgi:hypothetical protein
MAWEETFRTGGIALLLAMMPLWIMVLNRLHQSNIRYLASIDAKLVHMDECIDKMREPTIRLAEFSDLRDRIKLLEDRMLANRQ